MMRNVDMTSATEARATMTTTKMTRSNLRLTRSTQTTTKATTTTTTTTTTAISDQRSSRKRQPWPIVNHILVVRSQPLWTPPLLLLWMLLLLLLLLVCGSLGTRTTITTTPTTRAAFSVSLLGGYCRGGMEVQRSNRLLQRQQQQERGAKSRSEFHVLPKTQCVDPFVGCSYHQQQKHHHHHQQQQQLQMGSSAWTTSRSRTRMSFISCWISTLSGGWHRSTSTLIQSHLPAFLEPPNKNNNSNNNNDTGGSSSSSWRGRRRPPPTRRRRQQQQQQQIETKSAVPVIQKDVLAHIIQPPSEEDDDDHNADDNDDIDEWVRPIDASVGAAIMVDDPSDRDMLVDDNDDDDDDSNSLSIQAVTAVDDEEVEDDLSTSPSDQVEFMATFVAFHLWQAVGKSAARQQQRMSLQQLSQPSSTTAEPMPSNIATAMTATMDNTNSTSGVHRQDGTATVERIGGPAAAASAEDSETPISMHQKEGDRNVALKDEFKAESRLPIVATDDIDNFDDTAIEPSTGNPSLTATTTSSTATSTAPVQSDPWAAAAKVDGGQSPMADIFAAADANQAARISNNTTGVAAGTTTASSATTTMATMIPPVISQEFGRPLPVIQEGLLPLRDGSWPVATTTSDATVAGTVGTDTTTTTMQERSFAAYKETTNNEDEYGESGSAVAKDTLQPPSKPAPLPTPPTLSKAFFVNSKSTSALESSSQPVTATSTPSSSSSLSSNSPNRGSMTTSNSSGGGPGIVSGKSSNDDGNINTISTGSATAVAVAVAAPPLLALSEQEMMQQEPNAVEWVDTVPMQSHHNGHNKNGHFNSRSRSSQQQDHIGDSSSSYDNHESHCADDDMLASSPLDLAPAKTRTVAEYSIETKKTATNNTFDDDDDDLSDSTTLFDVVNEVYQNGDAFDDDNDDDLDKLADDIQALIASAKRTSIEEATMTTDDIDTEEEEKRNQDSRLLLDEHVFASDHGDIDDGDDMYHHHHREQESSSLRVSSPFVPLTDDIHLESDDLSSPTLLTDAAVTKQRSVSIGTSSSMGSSGLNTNSNGLGLVLDDLDDDDDDVGDDNIAFNPVDDEHDEDWIAREIAKLGTVANCRNQALDRLDSDLARNERAMKAMYGDEWDRFDGDHDGDDAEMKGEGGNLDDMDHDPNDKNEEDEQIDDLSLLRRTHSAADLVETIGTFRSSNNIEQEDGMNVMDGGSYGDVAATMPDVAAVVDVQNNMKQQLEQQQQADRVVVGPRKMEENQLSKPQPYQQQQQNQSSSPMLEGPVKLDNWFRDDDDDVDNDSKENRAAADNNINDKDAIMEQVSDLLAAVEEVSKQQRQQQEQQHHSSQQRQAQLASSSSSSSTTTRQQQQRRRPVVVTANVREQAYTILLDLGMIQETPNPYDPTYDHSCDDELCFENQWKSQDS